jgi:hypothetical protein
VNDFVNVDVIELKLSYQIRLQQTWVTSTWQRTQPKKVKLTSEFAKIYSFFSFHETFLCSLSWQGGGKVYNTGEMPEYSDHRLIATYNTATLVKYPPFYQPSSSPWILVVTSARC